MWNISIIMFLLATMITIIVIVIVSVMSDSLWSHGLQHARLTCPSLSPGACANSHLLSQWCHPTISSSVTSSSFGPQSFPASGSFLTSQLFASGSQIIGASASASVLPMNIQEEANYFTISWWFLPYIDMNQPRV